MEFRHPGLQRFWENNDASRLNPNHIGRITRILAVLATAQGPAEVDFPGYRLHQLTGNRRGFWSVRVSGNWRITFRFVDGEAVDIDLVDYHLGYVMTTRNRAHPSEVLQDSLDEMDWSFDEFADKLGLSHDALDQFMHGRCGISPSMALALERIGWSSAEFWMRLQANYDLAQARRERKQGLAPGTS